MTRTIGTCGRCGGPVIVPQLWMGVFPPTPQCAHCGAEPHACHGHVLPMKAPAPQTLHPSTLREKKHHGSHRL